jgi:altronate dehydratase large subunit
MSRHFRGFRRPDGSVGIRNHLAVISCQASVNAITRRIAESCGAQPVLHDHESFEAGPDAPMVFRSLTGLANHPNTAAAVLVCIDRRSAERIADCVADKAISVIALEETGGARAAVQRGIDAAERLQGPLRSWQRIEVDASELRVGLKCGGSDSMSALSCNPALGVACDMLVDEGGTCVLTETSGIYGAEFVLAQQASDEAVASRIYEIVDRVENEARRLGKSLAEGNPSPGNIEGGLTTLAEKSLGTVKKCGSRPIRDVIDFGAPITQRGVIIMDTPGLDVYSVSGPVAGGAQIVAFTTGRGSPLGAPLSPVQKIIGNPNNFERLRHNMDINAGTIITGEHTLEEVGAQIFEQWLQIASGTETKAERWGHTEFALPRSGSVV